MIKVITGPMFSNKSTTLLHYVDFFRHIGKKKIYFIKPEIDTLHVDSIGARKRAPIFANSFPKNMNVNEYSEYLEAFDKYRMDVVIIDEAQFFGVWIVDFCFRLRLLGVEVVIAGLDMDSFGNPFGHMGELMCIADEIEKKKATCSICGSEAAYTYKKNDNPSQISIGGDEKYEARCIKHLTSTS